MTVPLGAQYAEKSIDRRHRYPHLTWPALVAPILRRPAGGGVITSYSSWRWIFFINIPLGIVAIIIAWLIIPNSRENHPQPFDKMGFVSIGLAMLCLVTALELCSQLPVIWWCPNSG
nr:hypothetical protein [Sodalis glossinidius]